jgi:hypothetical protein
MGTAKSRGRLIGACLEHACRFHHGLYAVDDTLSPPATISSIVTRRSGMAAPYIAHFCLAPSKPGVCPGRAA